MFPKTTWTHQHAVEKNHCSKLNELYWRCSRICVLCVTSILRKAVIYQTTKQRRKVDFSSMGRRLRGFVTDFKTGWSNWKIFSFPFSQLFFSCLLLFENVIPAREFQEHGCRQILPQGCPRQVVWSAEKVFCRVPYRCQFRRTFENSGHSVQLGH